jgi:hypothetical protein
MTLTFNIFYNEQPAPINLCIKIIFLTFYTIGQDLKSASLPGHICLQSADSVFSGRP